MKSVRQFALISTSMFLVCCGNNPTPEEQLGSVMANVRELGGPESRECGFVSNGFDTAEAFKCAEISTTSRKAFHVAAQNQDGGWSAATFKPNGINFFISYDSDPP